MFASRIVLTAVDQTDAVAVSAWFHLDQGFMDALRAGDDVYLARTSRGGLGVSVIRGGRLIMAAGAVTAVPLANLKAIVRRDQLVRPIPQCGTDADLPWLHPIQITTADRLPRRPDGYAIRVWCPAWPPPHDTDECASIVRVGACPPMAAAISALLLALSDALHVEGTERVGNT